MHKLIKKFICLAISLVSSHSFAGNGSSAGGFIYGNRLNPWFLKNTHTISYCNDLNPFFSDLTEPQIDTQIQHAWTFWKEVMQDLNPIQRNRIHFTTSPHERDLGIGVQNLVKVNNCQNADIRFQLGQLSKEQQSYLNPEHIIGLAFRESYDTVNLKGKGYIYIAPERGTYDLS